MIISEKQQQSNRKNAQHSTGPKTAEGKQAVRLNALQYGLSARSIILPFEDPEAYKRIWAQLEDEWHPRTFTERFQIEQMANALWIIARIGDAEHSIYRDPMSGEQRLSLIEKIGRQRTRLTRQFNTAMHALAHLQQKGKVHRTQEPKAPKLKSDPVHYVPSAPPEVPIHAYVMSEAFATDSR